VEGKNIAIEIRFTDFRPELMHEVAGDLVRLKVNVIFAIGPDAVAAAKSATRSIVTISILQPRDVFADTECAVSVSHAAGKKK
jgi:putative ABC transport system substrate-binding protein